MRYEKKGLLFFVVFSLIVVAPSLALAETSLDLYMGAAFTQEADATVRVNGFKETDEVDWDPSITGGGRIGYWFSELSWLGIALDLAYFRPEEDDTEVDIFVTSALVMFRYVEGQFHPYAGIGPALFYSNADVGGVDGFEDDSVDLGLDAKAGVSYDIRENIAVFGEYRFTYFEPEYNDKIRGVNVEIEPEFYTHHLLLGVSFRF